MTSRPAIKCSAVKRWQFSLQVHSLSPVDQSVPACEFWLSLLWNDSFCRLRIREARLWRYETHLPCLPIVIDTNFLRACLAFGSSFKIFQLQFLLLSFRPVPRPGSHPCRAHKLDIWVLETSLVVILFGQLGLFTLCAAVFVFIELAPLHPIMATAFTVPTQFFFITLRMIQILPNLISLWSVSYPTQVFLPTSRLFEENCLIMPNKEGLLKIKKILPDFLLVFGTHRPYRPVAILTGSPLTLTDLVKIIILLYR